MVFAAFLIVVMLTAVAVFGHPGLKRFRRNRRGSRNSAAPQPLTLPRIELVSGIDRIETSATGRSEATADPESFLAARRLAGDLSADDYRQAMEALAIADARRHPLAIPWDG